MDCTSRAGTRREVTWGGIHFLAAGIATSLCFFLSWLCVAGAQTTTDLNDRFRRATQAMNEGRLSEAAEGFAAVAGSQPSFAEAHLNLGLVLEEQGQYGGAVASLQRALTLKPRLRGANLFLGIAYYRLNQLEKAVSAFRKETVNQPSDANAWMWLGVAQLAAEHPEDATAALDHASQLAPDNVDILYHRGRAHLLVSKKSYERMFKVDPDSWRVHQVLAQAFVESDRNMDAISEYEAAIQLAPGQPGLHEELGTAYRNAGKLEAAEVAYQREVEIDPNNPLAIFKLGTAQVDLGKSADGKKSIEAALKLDPKLQDASYYLGRAEMQLGDDGGAADLFKRAVSENSEPEIAQQSWYQLGIVYRRLHRLDEARQAMATFERLKSEETQNAQERLKKLKTQPNSDAVQPPLSPTDPQ